MRSSTLGYNGYNTGLVGNPLLAGSAYVGGNPYLGTSNSYANANLTNTLVQNAMVKNELRRSGLIA